MGINSTITPIVPRNESTIARQRTFNVVVRHLREQGAKSLSGEGCAYRGECGRKCAVGVLIDDDYYSPSLENLTVVNPMVAAIVGTLQYSLDVARRMQKIHDIFPVSKWEHCYNIVAKDFNLQYEPPAVAATTGS